MLNTQPVTVVGLLEGLNTGALDGAVGLLVGETAVPPVLCEGERVGVTAIGVEDGDNVGMLDGIDSGALDGEEVGATTFTPEPVNGAVVGFLDG